MSIIHFRNQNLYCVHMIIKYNIIYIYIYIYLLCLLHGAKHGYVGREPITWCQVNGTYEGQIIFNVKYPLPLDQVMEIPPFNKMGDNCVAHCFVWIIMQSYT